MAREWSPAGRVCLPSLDLRQATGFAVHNKCCHRSGSFIRALLHVLDLRDRILAATHRLADLEAFELRMVEVERLVLAGVPMGETECFRLGPGFERRLALPYCM